MTDCSCGGNHTEAIDEEVVETEDVEIAAGLDEPVEVGKEEAVLKDMEETLMKLKEVINYLSEKEEEKMDEEKMDEEKMYGEEKDEEDEEEKEDEEEEEKMMEEKKPKKKDDIDDLYKAVTTLKKHGIGVYTGQKATPAPTTEATIEEKTIDWNNLSKSWDELEDMVGGN
tara:strand:- start:22 stop:531 length:510 start_codon:yes stop_codon:yes gene_type:complete